MLDQVLTKDEAVVKRFVRRLSGASRPAARAVIQTALGKVAQVDYGEGPMVRDPATGKYRRCRLLVLTLGASRKAVRLLTVRSVRAVGLRAALGFKVVRQVGQS